MPVGIDRGLCGFGTCVRRIVEHAQHLLRAGVELSAGASSRVGVEPLIGGELGLHRGVEHHRGEVELGLRPSRPTGRPAGPRRRRSPTTASAPGISMQPKSVPGDLAGRAPFALHPVAVDLHQRLAGDDRVGGHVPVAVDRALVGRLLEAAQPVEQCRASRRCRAPPDRAPRRRSWCRTRGRRSAPASAWVR